MKYNIIKWGGYASQWSINRDRDNSILAIILVSPEGHPFEIHFATDLIHECEEILKFISEKEKKGAFIYE